MKSKILILALLCSMPAWAQRMTKNLTEWQFSRDSLHWQNVVIPHDWAISGPFDKKWDLQCVAIEQNGETEATEKSGRSGALPWIGKGYYRTIVTVPDGYDAAELLFDGAMSEPVVKVNGKVAGEWKYGYNAFRVDISDFLRSQSTPRELTIEVDLQNVEESSRWYPGAGLYRPVTLIATSKAARIDDWGIMTQTTDIHLDKKDMAKLKVEVPIANYQKGMCIGLALLDADGKSLTQMTPAPMRDGKAQTTFMISNAKLWTPETPYLYKVRAALYDGKGNPSLWDDMGNIIDEKTINVGLRTIKVSKEGGFELNGVSRKLQGVCLHHDLGPLGAALDRAAVIRQIRILKDMGCDAIRTSHNMPSTMQMEVCDSMGMMVMAESFDMWIYPKCKNGYSRFFKEWALKDITNLVLNHRNHPSIVMWSIGNEIPEQWDADAGVYWAKKLQDTIH
ncbi:MAG: beta-galactosidase, partial [Prevotella sp.]|nr:beta-galactosidase [Prevotella sp.]